MIKSLFLTELERLSQIHKLFAFNFLRSLLTLHPQCVPVTPQNHYEIIYQLYMILFLHILLFCGIFRPLYPHVRVGFKFLVSIFHKDFYEGGIAYLTIVDTQFVCFFVEKKLVSFSVIVVVK